MKILVTIKEKSFECSQTAHFAKKCQIAAKLNTAAEHGDVQHVAEAMASEIEKATTPEGAETFAIAAAQELTPG